MSDNASEVLRARYLRRSPSTGEVCETPDELFERVARAISEAELLHASAAAARRWEARFLEMMTTLEFLPASPTLMNAGTSLGQLSACFVLPVEDTMESIFDTLRDMAQIQRTGGGTGFSFSRLRPAGSLIASTGGAASGPVGFMKIYDCATDHIRQGGKRRGANMGVLRIDHPDVELFVDAKRDPSALRNFNLSVAVTDAFMAAVERGDDVPLRHPTDGREIGRRPAADLFDGICRAAWATGDPGLLFLDAIERANPTPAQGCIEATNPCGEVPLLPYEACNLGSLDLARFVADGGDRPRLDLERLGRRVHDAVRFLDDVVTVGRFPLPAIDTVTRRNRKIGLGVMGFAELLVHLGISYADEAAVRLADEVMAFIATEARLASEQLADERGPFPAFRESAYGHAPRPLRNATRTSIAPTGTIGIVAGTSGGIEPLFALAYRRAALDGRTLVELNPLFRREVERAGVDPRPLLEHVTRTGRIGDFPAVPPALRRLFLTALEIPVEQHVRVQAAFQKHVDNAVSKTINLPEEATVADVAAAYRLAHRLGCKGATIFRYGSRDPVLQLGLDEESWQREHFTKCDPGACRL